MTYDKKLFFFFSHALFISLFFDDFFFGKKIANLTEYKIQARVKNSKDEEKRR